MLLICAGRWALRRRSAPKWSRCWSVLGWNSRLLAKCRMESRADSAAHERDRKDARTYSAGHANEARQSTRAPRRRRDAGTEAPLLPKRVTDQSERGTHHDESRAVPLSRQSKNRGNDPPRFCQCARSCVQVGRALRIANRRLPSSTEGSGEPGQVIPLRTEPNGSRLGVRDALTIALRPPR